MTKSFPSRFTLCFGLVAIAPLAQAAAPAVKPAAATEAAPLPDYVLQRGDTIMVQILGEDKLNEQMKAIKITQDYTIQIPMIDEPLNLAGKTLRQAEQIIHDRYVPHYLKHPSIRVSVADYVLRTVNVMGAVNTPKIINIDPYRGLKLMDAITQAGGYTPKAQPSRVKLTRTNADGTKQVIPIDAAKLIRDANGKNDWPLQPDDIIYVEEIVI